MFCPNCGSNVPDTEKFCPTCGTAMNGGSEAAHAAPQAPAAKSNDIVSLIKSKWPIAAIAVGAIVVVVILFNLLFGGAEAAAEKYVKRNLKLNYEGADKCLLVRAEDRIDAEADAADMSLEDYLKQAYEVDDMDEYFEDRAEKTDENNKDAYGSNWKASCKVLDSQELTNDEYDELEKRLEEYENKELIEEADDYDKAYKVWIQVKKSGEDGKDYYITEVVVVKDGLGWKVVG